MHYNDFMIQLKPHGWEKSGCLVKCKNAFGQSDCINISKTIGGIKLIFYM